MDLQGKFHNRTATTGQNRTKTVNCTRFLVENHAKINSETVHVFYRLQLHIFWNFTQLKIALKYINFNSTYTPYETAPGSSDINSIINISSDPTELSLGWTKAPESTLERYIRVFEYIVILLNFWYLISKYIDFLWALQYLTKTKCDRATAGGLGIWPEGEYSLNA